MLITKRELVRFESEHGKTDTTDMEPAAPTPALNPVEVYLEQHSNSPLKEKVRWLRENARISNADIGDLLNIGTADPKSRGSRKQKVQDFYRANFDDETWQKMHPEKKYKK
jgi:hypothetical protein